MLGWKFRNSEDSKKKKGNSEDCQWFGEQLKQYFEQASSIRSEFLMFLWDAQILKLPLQYSKLKWGYFIWQSDIACILFMSSVQWTIKKKKVLLDICILNKGQVLNDLMLFTIQKTLVLPSFTTNFKYLLTTFWNHLLVRCEIMNSAQTKTHE